ncbi:MAG TPA: rod shape-determining protein MreC [Candidatus Baltobacteraceae bacterium]
MVSIFTYRDERKLLSVIGGVIVAAVIALIQISAVRSGKTSPVSAAIATLVAGPQAVVSALGNAVRGAARSVVDVPRLWSENGALREKNRVLREENDQLRESLATAGEKAAIARASSGHPTGITAQTIGYDPENQSRLITIDRGAYAGVVADEGVIASDGVVGRVLAVMPFTSTVLLVTDPASKVPAVVRRGRWWGIATGTGNSVQMQYISQDASLRPGDTVITGEGLSFHAGLPLGRVVRIYHPEGALYQAATLIPAVALGRLDHVLVLPK